MPTRAAVLLLLSLVSFPQKSIDQRGALEQILSQTYQPTDFGKRVMGMGAETDVRKPGTIVVVQREGLYGSLLRSEIASSAVDDLTAKLFRGHQDFALPVGEPLYVTSVHVGPSAVNLAFLSVRPVSTPKGTNRLWTTVAFNFPDEVLAKGDKDTVYREIDKWFLPEGRSTYAQPSAQGAPSAAPAASPASAPVPVAVPAPSAPATLTPGMSRQQVIAALGAPQREVNFESQTWLHYPSLVVLFKDGKLVSATQPDSASAIVALQSDPPGAEIYLDGQLVGSTPSTLQIASGNHQLALRLAGFQDWTRDLHILPASQIQFSPKLQKD
jgi:PEGA domain/SmpA / OmlA family